MKNVPIILILILIALLTPGVSFAGGDSWQFQVESFSQASADSATVSLRPTTAGAPYFGSGCDSMQVFVRFERGALEKWGVSRAAHQKALLKIRLAFDSNDLLQFGVMAGGLEPVRGSRCSFQINAIAEVEEYNGRIAVYSFQ